VKWKKPNSNRKNPGNFSVNFTPPFTLLFLLLHGFVFLKTNEVLEDGIMPSVFSYLCFMALFAKKLFLFWIYQ